MNDEMPPKEAPAASAWVAPLARFVERYLLNPQMRLGLALGLAPRAFALLETIGRHSGKPRRTPVGNGLLGDTFWLVSEHGRRAGYVHNIERTPRVRVKVGRTWHAGTAHVLDGDDPFARLDTVAAALGRMRRLDAAVFRFFVRQLGTRPVTVRIDLDLSRAVSQGCDHHRRRKARGLVASSSRAELHPFDGHISSSRGVIEVSDKTQPM